MRIRAPIVLAGVLVLALAMAVALTTLAEEATPVAAIQPIHRTGRVAGAVTDFTPGTVSFSLAGTKPSETFSIFLSQPTTVYQMLVLVENRMTMPVAWGTDATGAAMLLRLGSLVAGSEEQITATVNGKAAPLDETVLLPNDTVHFSLTKS